MNLLAGNAIEIARFVGFVALSLLGSWICLQNWRVFWAGAVRRERTGSCTPLLGAVLVALGFAYSPWRTLAALWWLPFLCDWGSVPWLVYTAVALVRQRQV